MRTPNGITRRGPKRSIAMPMNGVYSAETQKADREGAGDRRPVPAELVEDRREEQREGGPRVDPDRHRDERHRHDHPAVEEGQPGQARSGGTGADVRTARGRPWAELPVDGVQAAG